MSCPVIPLGVVLILSCAELTAQKLVLFELHIVHSQPIQGSSTIRAAKPSSHSHRIAQNPCIKTHPEMMSTAG